MLQSCRTLKKEYRSARGTVDLPFIGSVKRRRLTLGRTGIYHRA